MKISPRTAHNLSALTAAALICIGAYLAFGTFGLGCSLLLIGTLQAL